MIELFPNSEQFPDTSAELFELMQEQIIAEIDEILMPDDPNFKLRKQALFEKLVERSKPPILTPKHPENILDRMRSQYISNRLFLKGDGYDITDETSVKEFWETYYYAQKKYKSKS